MSREVRCLPNLYWSDDDGDECRAALEDYGYKIEIKYGITRVGYVCVGGSDTYKKGEKCPESLDEFIKTSGFCAFLKNSRGETDEEIAPSVEAFWIYIRDHMQGNRVTAKKACDDKRPEDSVTARKLSDDKPGTDPRSQTASDSLLCRIFSGIWGTKR